MKSAGMLALNDASSARSTTVTTPWSNTVLRDVYSENPSFDMETDDEGSGFVTLPPRSYRLYVPLNALP